MMNNSAKKKWKIFLTGADGYQWALQEDYNQTVLAAQDLCDFVPMQSCKMIHSVYWESLKQIPETELDAKPVICNLSGEWGRYENDFGESFLKIAAKVDIWVVRSKAAEIALQEKGYRTFLIPYTVNTAIFRPLDEREKMDLRRKLKIPADRYLIGNFMRDSTAGRMCAPKLVKGPDIFVEIVDRLCRKKLPVHVLLAGPRRHWIRKQLAEREIPYSYAGFRLWFDDMRINTLKRPRLNELYNILDLSLVTSRSEAGPHAILEAAAARCPQLSSRVGIAADVLDEGLIYDSVEKAVRLIEEDITIRLLLKSAEISYKKVQDLYTAEANTARYAELYEIASGAGVIKTGK